MWQSEALPQLPFRLPAGAGAAVGEVGLEIPVGRPLLRDDPQVAHPNAPVLPSGCGYEAGRALMARANVTSGTVEFQPRSMDDVEAMRAT